MDPVTDKKKWSPILRGLVARGRYVIEIVMGPRSESATPIEPPPTGVVHLSPLTKLPNQEYRDTMDSTNDNIARNWSCFMSIKLSVTDGLRLLELLAGLSSPSSIMLTVLFVR